MLRHQLRFSMAWILHWGRLWLPNLPRNVSLPWSFSSHCKCIPPSLHSHSGLHFSSWHFTDPCMFTFKTSIVFSLITGKAVFVVRCPYKFTPNSRWIKIQSTEKPFSAFGFYNFALLSINVLFWPCIFYLFPSCCSFIIIINGKLLHFVVKGTNH